LVWTFHDLTSKACRNPASKIQSLPKWSKKQIREVNSETDKASKMKTRRQNSEACRHPASKIKSLPQWSKKQIREDNSETDKASKLETRHQNTKACRNSQKNKSGKKTPKPAKRQN